MDMRITSYSAKKWLLSIKANEHFEMILSLFYNKIVLKNIEFG